MAETENLKKDQNEKKMKSFVTRLLSGIVLVLIAILTVPRGGLPLFVLTFLISMIGLFELYRVFGIEHTSLGLVGYLTTIGYYIIVWFHVEEYYPLMIVLSLMALMAFYVITYPAYKISQVAKAFMGFCYAGIMMSYIYQTRELPDGKYLVWLIFLASWGSDTCAYCAGMLFGRHKMTPILSPKKTVEGAVAALQEGRQPAIVTRRPCLLIKRQKPQVGMCVVNADKCRSCKSCLKVGCPAISMENGKAFIDRTQCVGCTVCAQACPFDAIEKEEK